LHSWQQGSLRGPVGSGERQPGNQKRCSFQRHVHMESTATLEIRPCYSGFVPEYHIRHFWRKPLNLQIDFVRHPRARRYVIRVRPDGSVRVTVPRWGSRRHAEQFAEQQADWIERQRRDVEERRQTAVERSPAELKELRTRAARELPTRLRELAQQHGLGVAKVSIRNQRWRWGSCSPKGHICLNWRLVLMPDAVRDYVIIHELMHLRRLDHSPTFWKLVAAACPDFEAARDWLRINRPTSG
jgi:predicted metal-dependent hydrolase